MIILIRHGQTNENKNGINQGQTDSFLNKTGKMQAEKAAEFLKDYSINVAFSSDLKRAAETMNIIMKYHKDAEIYYDKRLRERKLGVFEGSKDGSLMKAAKENGLSFFEFKPEGGESVGEFRKRVVECFNEIKNKYSNKNVLIVTHGGTIINILREYYKITEENFKKYLPGNTAITIINNNKVEVLNSLEHLPESLKTRKGIDP